MARAILACYKIDDNSTMALPDPFPDSAVKHRSADGRVA